MPTQPSVLDKQKADEIPVPFVLPKLRPVCLPKVLDEAADRKENTGTAEAVKPSEIPENSMTKNKPEVVTRSGKIIMLINKMKFNYIFNYY